MTQSTDELLSKAKNLINDFCLKEYGNDADFSDLLKIEIAYTDRIDEVTGIKQPAQVIINLQECAIITMVDGDQIDKLSYDSMEEFIENELQWLNFDALVSPYL